MIFLRAGLGNKVTIFSQVRKIIGLGLRFGWNNCNWWLEYPDWRVERQENWI
jgi:hypothetical protein